MEFQGRSADLELLDGQLRIVTEGRGATAGKAVIMTGRRRVGKSRLVEEFCERSGLPYAVFQATRGRIPSAERADFLDALAQSPLPGAELIAGLRANDWNQALRAAAVAVPSDSPSVLVIDEVPWLVQQDAEFEGALQTVWDRALSAKPLLLILVGSDMSTMEALQSYGRPFFGRGTPMVISPLHLADVQSATELPAAEAIDALLITGGFPEIVQSWRPGVSPNDFLRESFMTPLSPLLAAGELSLLAEFAETSLARAVLEATGSGERSFSAIAHYAGGTGPLPSGTLSPLLRTLRAKRVLAMDLPLSTKPDTKNKRYRVADPYLRFWLAFLQRAIPLVERGRGDLALRHVQESWASWRGRAIEPLVRESLLRLLPDRGFVEVSAVGSWWNRQNNPEIDLVAADKAPLAGQVFLAGSVKWLENKPFGRRDYDALVRDVDAIPGVQPTTPLVAVSRSGVADDLPLAAHWGPEDLVQAWQRDAR